MCIFGHMKRRTLLIGAGAAAAGSGIVFGSGAFTQVGADREVTIGVDDDSQALLGLVPNDDVEAVDEVDGDLTIDSNQLSDGGEGFNVDATVAIGETTDGDVEDGDEAFKVVNNFDSNVGLEVDLTDLDSDSELTFITTRSDNGDTNEVDDGNAIEFEGFTSGAELRVAIEVETGASEDDFDGDVVFTADPTEESAPIVENQIRNTRTGENYDDLDDAVTEAEEDDTLVLGSSNSSYTLTQTIEVSGLTLEGPNAGTPGDDSRESEAIISGGGSTNAVRIDADGVTLDGIQIQNVDGSGGGETEINAVGVRVDEEATGVTIENTVITDIGTHVETNPRGVQAFSGAHDLTVADNKITTLDGTDADERQAEAVQVIEENDGEAGEPTSIENVTVSGNTISHVNDTRSAVGVRFNGNIDGDITDNDISELNTDGPDNTGFTQAIALAAGGNATSAPADVTITENEIFNLETGPEDDSAPATHLILSSVEDADTVEVENNDFSAVSTGENYIFDNTEEFDMETLLGDNDFDPDGAIADGDDSNSIVSLEPGTALNVDTRESFSSITAALDEVEEGETVYVGEGTYEEEVTVLEHDVTLQAVDDVVIEGLSDKAVGIDLRGMDGVTIRGFTVQNFQNLIELRGSNNTFEDNTLSGITPDSPGFGEGFYDRSRRGFNLDGADNTVIRDNTIETCSRGVRLGGSGDKNNLVKDNLFEENFRAVAINSPSNEVRENDVIDSHAYSDEVEEANVGSPSGIRTFDTGSDSVIENNHIEGTDGYGISLRGDPGNEVRDNTIEDSEQAGVFLWEVEGQTIEENDIRNNNWMGVRVLESDDNDIINNQIDDNGEYEEDDDEFFGGVRLRDSDNNVVNDNTLDENYGHGVLVWDSNDNEVLNNDITLRFPDDYDEIHVTGDSEDNETDGGTQTDEFGGVSLDREE